MFSGGGSYAITDVKEVDGTDEFINFAEEAGICQNKEKVSQCLTNLFIREASKQCKCSPFNLKTFLREV